MKTWRERIAEARARRNSWPGRLWRCSWFYRMIDWRWPFVDEDATRAARIATCAAGEVITRYGLDGHDMRTHDLYSLGNSLQVALHHRDVTECERLLDLIEDLALELKRQQ